MPNRQDLTAMTERAHISDVEVWRELVEADGPAEPPAPADGVYRDFEGSPMYYDATEFPDLEANIAKESLLYDSEAELLSMMGLENACTPAAVQLAKRLLQGYGVVQDKSAGFAWMCQAAKLRDSEARIEIAMMALEEATTSAERIEATAVWLAGWAHCPHIADRYCEDFENNVSAHELLEASTRSRQLRPLPN
jgi:hypothetical protein